MLEAVLAQDRLTRLQGPIERRALKPLLLKRIPFEYHPRLESVYSRLVTIWMTGFEPATARPPGDYSTRLSYIQLIGSRDLDWRSHKSRNQRQGNGYPQRRLALVRTAGLEPARFPAPEAGGEPNTPSFCLKLSPISVKIRNQAEVHPVQVVPVASLQSPQTSQSLYLSGTRESNSVLSAPNRVRYRNACACYSSSFSTGVSALYPDQ